MATDDSKVEIPPELAKDPEVIAVQRQNLLSALRLSRYINIAKAIGFFLRTFKSEAVSLVSGIMTLVLGYKQFMKYATRGSQEVVKGATWKKEREHPSRSEFRSLSGGGSGRGMGHSEARLGGASKPIAPMSVTSVPEVPVGATMTLSVSNEVLVNPMKDPGNYSFAAVLLLCLASSTVAWFKKRRKSGEERRNPT